MKLQATKTENRYHHYLKYVDRILQSPPPIRLKAGKHRELMLVLIKDYEDKTFPIPALKA